MSWNIIKEIRKLRQKATSPAYDADTDSNEALREVLTQTSDGTIVEGTSTAVAKLTSVAIIAQNTFTDWEEHDAAVSADSWINAIQVYTDTTQNYVLEVGTGAALSETTKIRFSARLILNMPVMYTLAVPIKVPSGTRIAVRAADPASGGFPNVVTFGISMYQNLG